MEALLPENDSDRNELAARELLRWFDREKRDLPWRRSVDPYRIWVSEIMLQQTRVDTVIPYYETFLERFPTVEDLAAAPVDDVMAMWSGLGYYRRARQLHSAACEVAEQGNFPSTAATLRELSGIGEYTSAAIASMAFGEVVPVLDGNVERVLCRRLALLENPKRVAVRRVLLREAARLLDPERPGDGNQALMELGATVCTPKNPKCGVCPLDSGCAAREEGEPERYPPAKKRRQVERVELAVVRVEREGRILFFRRPDHLEVMPGLWELPNVPWSRRRGEREEQLGRRYGGEWILGSVERKVRHAVTYRAMTLYIQEGNLEWGGTVGEGPEARWIGDEERSRYAMSSMVEKALTARADSSE